MRPVNGLDSPISTKRFFVVLNEGVYEGLVLAKSIDGHLVPGTLFGDVFFLLGIHAICR